LLAPMRPPHSLLAALLVTTIVVTVALGWAAWRLLDQQRAIDEQRAREQLEISADAIASRVGGALAEAGDWLSEWASSPASSPPLVDGAVALAIVEEGIRITPSGGLPFVPTLGEAPRPIDAFTAIERAEFAGDRPSGVADRYRALAASRDAPVRAGALLRLGRVLRKTGDFTGALAAYRQLGDLGAVRTEGLPADLAGLAGQRAVYLAMGDRDGERRVATQMSQGLDGGRWLVTRGVAEYLRDEVGGPDRPDSWRLADALSDVWRATQGRLTARGQRVLSKNGRGVLVLWRSDAARTALLAAFADRLITPPASAAIAWQLVDPAGQLIAGAAAVRPRSVARIIGSAEYPWTLHVWPTARPPESVPGFRTILVTMMAAMLVFLWAASYFMGRAIRREAEVARLQSDFVAAVSHEFRSPLTAVRQMAEMLEMDRLPTEERRHAYYRTIAGEAGRLQRLVETLLNFGKMEAGAARYHFVDMDVPALVRTVVQDIEPQARAAGANIETSGPEAGLHVLADESALAVALRNLIDNAIKYSPGQSTVRVEWAAEGDRVAISVIDRGPGIPRKEQQAIFRKFVRGRTAAEGRVQGTGVGLTMAQEIVRAHGGEIRLASEVGQGSRFTILLPRTAEPAGPRPMQAASASHRD
jgi:two-component system, OmpR family, phosphate regulon sensor histidine kinase PhoR